MSDDYGCAFCNGVDASHIWGMDDTGDDRPWWRAWDFWCVCLDCQEDADNRTEHRIIDRANALQTLQPIEAYTAEDLEPLRAGLAKAIAYWISHRTTCRPVD